MGAILVGKAYCVITSREYNIEGVLCFKLDNQKMDVINRYWKLRQKSWFCEEECEFVLGIQGGNLEIEYVALEPKR